MEKHLIANELLPVYQTTDIGEKVVDARELHGFLNVGTRYNDWIKNRIEKYGFIDGEDFTTLTENLVSGGRQFSHVLKLEMAKELAMVENNEQGRKARKYFIEIEKRYRGGTVPTVSVHENPPGAEFDRVTRLLQMLRLGERDQLFSEATNRAIRTQVAEMVLGRTLTQPVQAEPEIVKAPDQRPQWVKDGWGAKAIGYLAKCSATKVGIHAKKHGLQTDDYGGWYEYLSHGKLCKVFIYNEAGKDRLLELLSGPAKDAK